MVLLEDLGVVAAGELEAEELDEVGWAVGKAVNFCKGSCGFGDCVGQSDANFEALQSNRVSPVYSILYK